MTAEIADRIAGQLRLVEGLADAESVGVAVSGGGDSTALLFLMQAWCAQSGHRLQAVSVDHRLRPEGREECMFVSRVADDLGISHEILSGEIGPSGNLQESARLLRYSLIGNWAASNNLNYVALAHTLDDQAETLLLNLARGSGVDGLSAMPLILHRSGVIWIRPLLGVRRAELRNYLRVNGYSWKEDPTNTDARFDRVKARNLLKEISALGATVERLAATAGRMQDARVVLEAAAADAALRLAMTDDIGVTHFKDAFWSLPRDTRFRLAADAVRIAGRASYRPRIVPLGTALDSVRDGRTATLSGCMLMPTTGAGFMVVRELKSCGPPVPWHAIWDGRWKLVGKDAPDGSMIGPLGRDGLLLCANWRDVDRHRECLVSSPALRRHGELLSAPFAGMPNDWQFTRVEA